MKRNMWLWSAVAAIGLAGGTAAMADSTIFDRGLPTASVNASDSSRSNVAWADSESSSTPSDYYLPGDDFKLSGTANYQVSDIRVWVIGNNFLSGLSLLGGTAGGPMSTISSSFTVTPSSYPNGDQYTGSSGSSLQVAQVDFSVNLNLAGGQTFDFFVDGPWNKDGSAYSNTFLAASNAALSGSTQEGADGATQWLHFTGGSSDVESWFSGTGGGTTGWSAGWDKNSDINVQVLGAVVAPLPASAWGGLALLGSLGLIAGAKRLRRRMA